MIENKELSFQEENDEILSKVLENIFFKAFRSPRGEREKDYSKYLGVELYVTPECNKYCSYCYLCKNKDELYPKELRDETTILNNLNILLKYFIEQNFMLTNLDIFSGEIWDRDFGIMILETILENVKKGLSVRRIMIPSNFNWFSNECYREKIVKIRNLFLEYDVVLMFSCSDDGYYLDAIERPLINKDNTEEKTLEYYDKLFKFCKEMNYGFHPMVASTSIKHWKENFTWWMENLNKYGLGQLNHIMFLEVRNDNWTEENIIDYIDYLKYVFDYYIKNVFDNDLNTVCDFMTNGITTKKLNQHYNPFKIIQNQYLMGCSIQRMLCIRLGDLGIAPCHRTSYDELMIGKFKVENNKIVGVSAKNIQIMNQIWLNNLLGSPKCNTCLYGPYCHKGCYGAQFESTGDMFFACESVCSMQQARMIFNYYMILHYKLYEINSKCNEYKIWIENTIKETEEFKKWSKIIQSKL